MHYSDYLMSVEWAEKRRETIADAGGCCEICGGRAIQAHHLSYENLGNEDPNDLLAVCVECHNAIHDDTLVVKLVLVKGEFVLDIIDHR